MKNTYLQIGPYAATGGVSIHIKRLSLLLGRHYHFRYIDESPRTTANNGIFNIRSFNILKYLKLIRGSDIVHIHTGIWWLRCAHIMVAVLMGKRTIVTIHSLTGLSTRFSLGAMRPILMLASRVIVVSMDIKKRLNLKKCVLLHAFIPPKIENEEELPAEIKAVIRSNKNKKIIVSNAFKLVFHKGEDLYGLDMLIDVASSIKKYGREYMIIFVIASRDEKSNIYDSYMQRIEKGKLQGIISIIPYPISFVKLIIESDLVVRATNTDGDALTVREALFLNRPIIASDVTQRPEGTVLFENRNSKDLFYIIDVLLRKPKGKDSEVSIDNLKDVDVFEQNYLSILSTK